MSSQDEAGDLVGEVLHDTYRITRLLGRGGMGAVYEAVHARLPDRRFAVKVMNPVVARNPEAFARFRREAEIATRLRHPNIADVMDFNATPAGLPYMVMELLEGEDMAQRLARRGRLPAAEVVAILTQAGSALTAAHRRGIVHRDLKPENIFLTRRPEGGELAKVLDFGISKIRHSKSIITQSQAVFGTPYYMSPEQADGQVEEIDETTDTFALGVMAYQALSGVLPFDAPTPPGVLYQVCHAEPRPIREIAPELPEALGPVLIHALDKRKTHRFPSVDRLLRALAGALDQEAPEPETTALPALEERDEPSPVTDSLAPTGEADMATAAWQPGRGSRDGGKARLRAAVLVGAVLVVGPLMAALLWPGESGDPGAGQGELQPDTGVALAAPATPPPSPDMAPPLLDVGSADTVAPPSPDSAARLKPRVKPTPRPVPRKPRPPGKKAGELPTFQEL